MSLKTAEELDEAPAEFQQKIEAASFPTSSAPASESDSSNSGKGRQNADSSDQATAESDAQKVKSPKKATKADSKAEPIVGKAQVSIKGSKSQKSTKAEGPSSKNKQAASQNKSEKKKARAKKSENGGKKVAAVQSWRAETWPFGIGEKFSMVLRYGPIEGGVVTFQVLEPKVINNEPVLHYTATVKSSKVLELFYKVNDTIESWVGMDDHLPRRQEIQQLESNQWGRRVVVFDQKKNKAKFYSHTTRKDGKVSEVNREDKMTRYAQDVFGALYFYRFFPDFDKVSFPIHDRWKNWSNELTFVGREEIEVPLGEFETLRFKMKPRVEGQLKPMGDVEMWVTDDERRLMVQFKAHIKVGAITGELKSYEPGRTPSFAPPEMHTPLTGK